MGPLVSRPAAVINRPEEMLVTLNRERHLTVWPPDLHQPVSEVVPLTKPDVDHGLGQGWNDH